MKGPPSLLVVLKSSNNIGEALSVGSVKVEHFNGHLNKKESRKALCIMKNNLNMTVVGHRNLGLAVAGKMAVIRVSVQDLVDLHACGFSVKHLDASRQIPNLPGSVLYL